MYKFIIDSDALIKLAKCGLLDLLCSSFHCTITQEIKSEAVDEGKKRMYEDALAIEDAIDRKLLKVAAVKRAKQIKEGLGKGEMSAAALYSHEKNRIIVTDDAAFIKYLEKNDMRFVLPADLILLLKASNIIDRRTALGCLGKMKPLIREEVYKDVKRDMEED